MDLQNEAIEIQKIFHQDYKTYWEETEAIKAHLEARFKALGVSKCPNSNCDNNGTIAYLTSNGDWEPEPCEWCHRKQELLNNVC